MAFNLFKKKYHKLDRDNLANAISIFSKILNGGKENERCFYEYGAVIMKIIVILSLIAFIAATINSMCATGYNTIYLMVETFFKNLN